MRPNPDRSVPTRAAALPAPAPNAGFAAFGGALALAAALALAFAAAPAFAQAPHSAAATGVPPGLAGKGGTPPGQSRRWAVGRPLPDGVEYRVIERWRRHGLPAPARGERYVRVGDHVLRVTEVTEAGLLVLAAVGAVEDVLRN